MPMVSFILHSASPVGTICIHRLKGSGDVVERIRRERQVFHFVLGEAILDTLQVTQIRQFAVNGALGGGNYLYSTLKFRHKLSVFF